jgi:hypothetical protein
MSKTNPKQKTNLSQDNWTKILVAIISTVIPGFVSILIFIFSNPTTTFNWIIIIGIGVVIGTVMGAAGMVAWDSFKKKNVIKASLTGFFIGLFVGIASVMAWDIHKNNSKNERDLWTFDQNAQSWLSEQPTKEKPEDAVSSVEWDSISQALRATFDFANVPNPLPGDVEPRATFYVKGINGNWSGFQGLQFTVENLSKHDLKAIFSISNGSCWYEFGADQNIAKMEKKILKFNLKADHYKTCKAYDYYGYPPVAFDQVWRFDIIIGTNENPWKDVNGDVLIDNIQLTDPVTP